MEKIILCLFFIDMSPSDACLPCVIVITCFLVQLILSYCLLAAWVANKICVDDQSSRGTVYADEALELKLTRYQRSGLAYVPLSCMGI